MSWLFDAKSYGLGCGYSGCKYVRATDARATEACVCVLNYPQHVERFLEAELAERIREVENLEWQLKDYEQNGVR